MYFAMVGIHVYPYFFQAQWITIVFCAMALVALKYALGMIVMWGIFRLDFPSASLISV